MKMRDKTKLVKQLEKELNNTLLRVNKIALDVNIILGFLDEKSDLIYVAEQLLLFNEKLTNLGY